MQRRAGMKAHTQKLAPSPASQPPLELRNLSLSYPLGAVTANQLLATGQEFKGTVVERAPVVNAVAQAVAADLVHPISGARPQEIFFLLTTLMQS